MTQSAREKWVAHYSEVALKGRNRPEFTRALRRNIARALIGLEPEVSHVDGRFLVETGPGDVGERLRKVFGLSWFARVADVKEDYAVISESALAVARASGSETFKVASKRADKSFHLTSAEVEARVGADIVSGTGKKVSLKDPGLTVHVDVLRGRALVYGERSRGVGGLPLDTSGRAMLLFSGGIDSPVAAWLLMKRGCRPIYLHFYLAPTHSTVLESKVAELMRTLTSYAGRSTLVMVPFADYQVAAADAPGDLEPSLFRRFMRVTAEVLAPSFGASALATGDSLAQAASQTLWNLRSFDDGSSLPVLRPLLTYDKEEVVSMAKEIGTYEASIREYKDCCAIVTRHPRTRVPPEKVSEYALRYGFGDLAAKTVDKGTLAVFDARYPEVKVSPLRSTLSQDLRVPAAGTKI